MIYIALATTTALFQKELRSVPHINLVFYNDCMFLSHHLLSFPTLELSPPPFKGREIERERERDRERMQEREIEIEREKDKERERERGVTSFSLLLSVVSSIRDIGKQYLVTHIQEQRTHVIHLLAQSGGFTDIHKRSRYEDVMQNVKAAVHTVTRLYGMWKVGVVL